MSTISIAEMRKIQSFIPYDQWPNQFHTNCIAYALGLPIDDPKMELFNHLLIGNAEEKLKMIFEELHFEYRKICDASELKDGEYGIVLYHYFYEERRNEFGCRWTEHLEENHLVRIEPDRTWTHKFGWNYDTSVTDPQEIHDIILHDDHVDVQPTAYFAVRKPR